MYIAWERRSNVRARRKAVKELRRSIELDPSQPDAYLELAQLYRNAVREAESRNALREYLNFNRRIRNCDDGHAVSGVSLPLTSILADGILAPNIVRDA
jgi:hypothetical protein